MKLRKKILLKTILKKLKNDIKQIKNDIKELKHMLKSFMKSIVVEL